MGQKSVQYFRPFIIVQYTNSFLASATNLSSPYLMATYLVMDTYYVVNIQQNTHKPKKLSTTFERLLHGTEQGSYNTCKKSAKTYVRGIQVYYLWQPLFSVGVLQSKDASI